MTFHMVLLVLFLLTPVLKFNAPSTADKYRDIAVAMGVKNTERYEY